MGETGYHIPVLLTESISGLAIRPDGIYVDLTFGGGGHSREIIKRLKNGMLIAFDQDPAVEDHLIDDERFCFVRSNYRYLSNYLNYMEIEHVDGILADLGISSEHIDNPERGFSFRTDAELDMRMSPALEESAASMIARVGEEELAGILRDLGEVDQSRRIARQIVEARQVGPIKTTGQLVDCLKPLLPRNRENKVLAQVFQALRIAVNREIESLAGMLSQTASLLNEGGRLVVISYHSLEDRLVKNYIKAGNPDGVQNSDLYGVARVPFRAVNRKVIVPDEEEVARNPRARSAKLRIGERTEHKVHV
jgi:16S rRNA (cytosine1402-N4)-methyltransferase